MRKASREMDADKQGEEMKWRCSLTSTKVKITNLSPIFIRIDYFCNKV